MKKIGIFLVLLLFSLNIVLAESILSVNKETPILGETLFGEINGNFAKEIQINDIKFFQDTTQVYFDYDLTKYNDAYFFYVYLTRSGNFTIKVNVFPRDSLYSKILEKTIQVQENYTGGILEIKKGFVFSFLTPELTLKNVGRSSLSVSYLSERVTLSPDESQKIYFTPKEKFSYLTLSTYDRFDVPIIYTPPIIKAINQTENISPKIVEITPLPIKKVINIRANPSHLSLSTLTNKSISDVIELVNYGNVDVNSILISKNSSSLSYDPLAQIFSQSSSIFKINFFSAESGIFKDNLVLLFLSADPNINTTLIIPLEIAVSKIELPKPEIKTKSKTCSELNGLKCLSEKDCTGAITYAFDGYCCIGLCKTPEIEKEEKDYRWLIGIIILVVIALVGFLIYRKVEQTRSKTAEQVIRKRAKL